MSVTHRYWEDWIRYSSLIKLDSIGQMTSGEYPSFKAFCEARKEGRVNGVFLASNHQYDDSVTIAASNPHEEYRFVPFR